MVVMIFGSNPSQKSSNCTAFNIGTKSGSTLDKWLKHTEVSIDWLILSNVSNVPTPTNRPLTNKEIQDNLDRISGDIRQSNPDKIIALGKTAEKALSKLGVEFYAMPHPSGLNRQLNDAEFVAEKLNGLKSYLQPIQKSSND